MGGICLGRQETNGLKVATLNYSGILNSPFQFFSGDNVSQQNNLSETFQNILKQLEKKYKRETFKWGLGKIDQKIQKQRYTPIYRENCGIIGILNKRLISQEKQFQWIWQQQFNIARTNIFVQFTNQQKENTKKFDLLCYKAIIFYVYKVQSLKQVEGKQTTPYQNLMSKFFSKAFLNEQKKIKKTLQALENQKLDILFLQEANNFLKNSINKQIYEVITKQKSDSIIVIRRTSYKKLRNSQEIMKALGPENNNKLNWNNDTVICFVDNLVLISAHLTSKLQKNIQQIKILIQSINNITKMNPYINLIVGCDANTNIQKIQGFYIYPNNKSIYTTNKKRTMLQTQVNKANIQINECKDHIITNLKMSNCRVASIKNAPPNLIGYLPCQNHPYDHFVVMAQIDINQISI